MRRLFASILSALIILCGTYAMAEKIEYSEAIQYEYRESNKNDRVMYGYDGVWFVSPSSGIEVYLPAEWLETRMIKGYRDDFISFSTGSYDGRFRVYLEVTKYAEENAEEEFEFMNEHDMFSDRQLIPFGNTQLILYTAKHKSFDWNSCIRHVPGNGFSYTLTIDGCTFETLEEQEIIDNIINSYTIRYTS